MIEERWKLTTRFVTEGKLKDLPPGIYNAVIQEVHQAINEQGENEIRVYCSLAGEEKK